MSTYYADFPYITKKPRSNSLAENKISHSTIFYSWTGTTHIKQLSYHPFNIFGYNFINIPLNILVLRSQM